MLARLRSSRTPLALGAVFLVIVGYAVSTSSAAQVIPVPRVIAMVHTESGGVVRDVPVPLGGAPVPIDVDNGRLLGVLHPDIDVSVGMIAADELPGSPIVPNIIVRRDPTAVLRNAPAPNFSINVRIIIDDIGNDKVLATIDYGFSTPAGARVPPLVRAKLVGPIESGFVDPLVAKIETPGYAGPLDFKIKAATETFEGDFGLKFDPIPEEITITEDPRDDGLDFTYDHSGSVADVHLDATANLTDLATGRVRNIHANVERLPNHLELSNTNTSNQTFIDYQASSQVAKADLEADYRDTLGNGTLVTDANIKVSGLPGHMTGKIDTTPTPTGSDIDGVDFQVLDGEEIDAVDFIARNYTGTSGVVPEPQFGPDQFVAVASRRIDADRTLFRAAGHLEAIRGGTFKREGPKKDQLDVVTNVGDGTKPLRAVLDTDNRGAPAADSPKHLKVDATVTPLPRTIHAHFTPSTGSDPLHLEYDSSNPVDIDADVRIATGPSETCGSDRVVCALARVDKIPSQMDILLPGEGGTDFSLSHSGGSALHPDVRATIDVGPDSTQDPPSQRTWVNAELLRIPNEVRGRLDTAGGALRAAEFHGCDYDFGADPPACAAGTQDAIGRVSFTVRDRPDRSGLPPQPDVASQFVTLISRHRAADPALNPKRFEVMGRIDEVRNVVFHQLDREPGDDKTDGVLGVLVDVGAGGIPFDLAVDTLDDAFDDADPPVIIAGQTSKQDIRVNVASLPRTFTACVRNTEEVAPPDPGDLPQDALLAPCERTDVVNPDTGEHAVTPLSAHYTAVDQNGDPSPTKVTANVKSTAPDLEDLTPITKKPIPATSVLDLTIDKVPGSLRADVIPPITPDPAENIAGRKLKLVYDASSKIDTIDFALENRRATSICEDPRPARKALCVGGTLKSLPAKVSATFDPDDEKGDIEFVADPPASGDPKLSISPFHLSKVSPGAKDQPLVVDATVDGITPRLVGKFVSKHTPSDPVGEKSLAALNFNACPPGSPASCAGIDKITFTATNALVGDPLPNAPAPDGDTTQDFTFVQRGLDFRAKGSISQLKEIGLSKLKTDQTPSPTTKVRAAFGDGTSNEKLRAFIDRQTVTDPDANTGLEEQRVHAVISDAPKAINLCFRDKLEPGQFAEPQNSTTADFCDKAPAEKLAVQARLDQNASADKPDIDIRELHLSKGGGTDFLDGTVFIGNLAERIDVLAGKGEKTDILVEGHNIDDGLADPVRNVADRVRFNIRNYDGDDTGTGQFPFTSLSGAQDPESDPRVVDGTQKNFVKVVKDVNTLLLKGSIPDIKRVALQPGPCFTDDPRTPPSDAFTDSTLRPDYTCVNLIAAQNRPLGLAIRTKDDKNEILSMDEGFIDSVPGGDGGIFATLGKSPAKAKLNPTCGEPVGGTAAEGCKPTLLSVQALKASGQSTNLQAKLATGPETLVNDLKDVVPLDAYSSRLNYEAPVDSYDGDGNPATADSKGARLKLGTGKTGDAVRVGFNLDLPNYLDLDQPTSYSCKRDEIASGDVLSPDSAACKQTDVSAETNHGFESKDIAIRLVGANSGHLGTDVASLGRAAVLIHSTDDGKQTILTGPTPASGANGTVGDDPEDSPPETAPPAGAWDLGLDLPGYLDARVFIRSKYQAPGEDDVQTVYYQVDGRVNSPLGLNLRDVQSAALDGTLQTGRTRSGKDVAALQLALRAAPGLGDGAPDFSKPTFRVRAEMRKKHKEPDVGPYECNGFNPGGGRTAGFGANFCIYTPGDHIEKWLDVGLNMSPPAGHARTVDVVMDSTDYTQIDMRASELVDGSGGDVGKGADGRFTPQAGLRLQPFPIGLEIGLGLGIVGGNTLLLLDGDLILKLTGRENSRLRLSQNKGKMRLLAEDGPEHEAATVKTHDETVAVVQVRAEALFGLISENVVDVRTAPYHQPVEFKRCAFPGLGILPSGFDFFHVDRNDSTSTAIALTPGFLTAASGGTASAAEVLTGVSELLAPIWCFFSTDDNHLVTSSHPAPAFTEPGRTINGGGEAPPDATPPQVTPPQVPGDLTVESGDDIKLCGAVGFKNLVVESGGIIRAGNEGETLHDFVDIDGPGGNPPQPVDTPCDGSLTISASNVDVQSGGVITASAVRTSAGAGAGGAPGGGASHSGTGGTGGGGGLGSTVNYSGATEIQDFGSRGGAGSGSAAGGAGGGTLRFVVTNDLNVGGAIRANGGNGDPNTAACNASAAGGGSGGRVSLTANRVTVGGDVEARGGNGGAGGDAGGGGGGGRIAVNTVAPRPVSGELAVNGGSAGTDSAAAGCDAGAPGTGGNNTIGKTINFAAGVSIDTTADTPPTYVKTSVPIKIKAVKAGGGPLRVIVCRRSVGPATTDTFDNPALVPPTTVASAVGAAGCTTSSFSDADTPGGSLYTRTISRSVDDGFHGFYAVAAEPPDDDPNDCQDAGLFGDGCTYQEDLGTGDPVLPTVAQFKVAADGTGPDLSFSDENGEPGCAGGRKCLNQAGTMKVVSGDTVGGVGLTAVQCSINGGPFDLPCGPGETVSVDLGTTDGIADVRIKATDRLGNETEIAGPQWFTDRTPGQTPTITMTQTDGSPTNTWYHSAPHVTVHAEDGAAGFVGKPVTFFTDTSSKQCGTISDKSVTFGPLTFDLPLIVDCHSAETDPWVPSQGIHTFQAQATDRLGNKSLKSDVVRMKVDSIGPTTSIFLGPKKPDGKDDWYVTKPFVAFRSVDTVGGSGVNLKHPSGTSKIELNIDNQGWEDWDPNSPNELEDGIHEVCARGIDVAGNTGPQKCRSNIKVDTVAPEVFDPIAPDPENGLNGYYVSKPTVTPSATDAGTNTSGLERTDVQVDDTGWRPAEPTVMAEGTHTIKVRAFDNAGNAGTVRERTVRVDLSRPAARVGSYPPAPNGQGWFRQPRLDYLSARDGRDASGPDGVTYGVDGPATTVYTTPFAIGPGVHTTTITARDRAGWATSPAVTQGTKVDVTPPVAAPSPDKVGTLRLVRNLLGHLLPALSPATLKFNVTDDLGKVRVNVLLYNELEGLVKVLPATATYPGGFRDPGAGSVKWDGTGFDDLGVTPGVYHYRVQSTDQAGNTILSTDSPTFLVAVGLLPLLRSSAGAAADGPVVVDGATAGGADVAPGAATEPATRAPSSARKAVRITAGRVSGNRVTASLACASGGARCTGVLRVTTRGGAKVGAVRYGLAAGAKKTLSVRLSARRRATVRRARVLVLRAVGGGAATVSRTIRVR